MSRSEESSLATELTGAHELLTVTINDWCSAALAVAPGWVGRLVAAQLLMSGFTLAILVSLRRGDATGGLVRFGTGLGCWCAHVQCTQFAI